jgi:tRNA A-37 threonylcarbamoyl transferase component Bud32
MEPSQVGKYRIVAKIGQGAMGEVFRAHDPVLKRDVAIKVVSKNLSADEAARRRFVREAQAAAKLNHPNIITVHDFGEDQGMAYMAMELLEGGAELRDLIEKGAFERLEDKLTIVGQILAGLAFAHAKGVVHRDLKPGNVYVLPSGQAKITDFGLARLVKDEEGTKTTQIRGTPYYMAPELLRMAPELLRDEPPTARSDVFSVGALIYELLSGQRPFTGATIPAVLYKVVHSEAEPLGKVAPDVPPGMAAIVDRALAKDPAQRFANAGEMLQALRGVSTGEGPAGGPEAAAIADQAPPRALTRRLSASPEADLELRAAVEEVHEFLDDRVPPLIAADSVAALLKAPVEGVAAEIWAWAVEQERRQSDFPFVDLLFHALHKLGVMGELELVDAKALLPFLRELGQRLAQACEPEERDRLRLALVHLGESEMIRTGPLEMIRGASESERLPATAATTLSAAEARRLLLLEQRLLREGSLPAADPARRRLVAQALTAAATQAKSERELEVHLRRLRAAGVASGADQIFRSLGEGLPDWALPKELASDTADLPPAGEVKAMRQIVSLPEDPLEVARRLRHLVSAATEQFNEGNLGGAVQMLGLASALVAEKKVDPGFVNPIRARGHETLDQTRLRQYMEKPDRHSQLQAVMAFFEAGLGPASLLDQLEAEERRERRRLLLDLLVVHGEPARALARERLLASLEVAASEFTRRNWIYLLRHIPRTPTEAVESEIDAVARFARPDHPAFLVKEAMSFLAQTRHARAAQALVELLHAWEAELEGAEADTTAEQDGLAALDRVAGALARQANLKGWRALVDHALARRPELGATVDRLAELGSQDLSSCPDVVGRLLDELQQSLPRGVLGRLVGRRDQDLKALVASLAGTRAPEVRAALEDLARRFQGQESGRAAARALAGQTSAPVAPFAGLSGELEAYGLPAILHRLGQGRATGTLTLRPHDTGPPAMLAFDQGRLRAVRWAQREAVDAAYQLFERPFAGTFAFDSGRSVAAAHALPNLDALIREGMRRAGELRHAGAVVPDDAALEATGSAPSTVPDEPDYDLVVALWQRACGGTSARQMESELTADAFRIRHALAHWLEEGALRVAAAASPAEPVTPSTGTSA